MQEKQIGPQSIKKALEYGAKRIGHGVRCLEDPLLVGQLAQKEIPLEICPISNLQTKAIEDMKVIETLYRKGINSTINTDNNTVSNTNIIEEYKGILENTNLSIEDLAQMNKNAIRGAFISPQKKAELIARITERESKDILK